MPALAEIWKHSAELQNKEKGSRCFTGQNPWGSGFLFLHPCTWKISNAGYCTRTVAIDVMAMEKQRLLVGKLT